MSKIRILNAGDRAILLEFGENISPMINRRVHKFFFLIRDAKIPGIIEAVPGYRTLLIYYDPLMIETNVLKKEIRRIWKSIETAQWNPYWKTKKVRIPVVLGDEFGPDLESVAQFHSMGKEQMIGLFLKHDYSVYMIAFVPGAPLLARLPRRIATPRHKTPRLRVPMGSIGIGNVQIAIYPHDLPGGMQIVGRTPLKIYDPTREQLASLLDIGDRVKFERISEEEYRHIAESEQKNLNNYIIED